MSPQPDHPQPDAAPRQRSGPVRLVLLLFASARCLLYLLGLAWACGAIYYDGPIARNHGNTILALAYAVVAGFFLLGLPKPLHRFGGWIFAMALVAVPWFLLNPSPEGPWQAQWAHAARAKTDGDLITFKNFRNFDYDLEGKVTPRWEDRTVRLSRLRALDYFHHEIGGKLLAHPVLSFDFGEDGHVAFSIEARRHPGEEYSLLRGLYKRYGLIYLVGDERDFIRERATIRNEPVRLYRTTYTQARVREMFFETVATLNDLHRKPRFYHTVFANCTTCYLAQTPADKRGKPDYRVLLNGRIEALYAERGIIVTERLPLEELQERATINQAAREAHSDPAFPARIREGRPGFQADHPEPGTS